MWRTRACINQIISLVDCALIQFVVLTGILSRLSSSSLSVTHFTGRRSSLFESPLPHFQKVLTFQHSMHTCNIPQVRRMAVLGCDEAYLETEVTNKDSLKLYGKLGFVREERLVK